MEKDDGSGLSGFDIRSDASVLPDASDSAVEFQRFFFNILPTVDVLRLKQLADKIRQLLPPSEQAMSYGADYDIKVEIESLIQSVRAMQDSVMYGGKIRPGITPKEMREVVASTTSLLSLLVKTHEKFMGLDRQRELERTTIEVLKELGGEEVANQFVAMMEERLSA